MKKQTQKTKSIALIGILTALMILMSFTPIGYFRSGTIEVSLLMIPVAIGAVALIYEVTLSGQRQSESTI